ncbi:hypothetical protein EDC96DRAFT_609499 [Choanephora cucurbitarum]|nr:hypothetical protein EDC96DRAFT_609499 [Choanephora cucurbitarum]
MADKYTGPLTVWYALTAFSDPDNNCLSVSDLTVVATLIKISTTATSKLLGPYQLYILKALPSEEEPEKEVDLNDFFVHFGFRHRKTAEAAFERSIRKIVQLDQTTDDQKEYIKEVYLDNEFEEVFNTDKLNKYWSVTERTVEEDRIIKRKQEAIVNQLVIPERNMKERKIAANTSRNCILLLEGKVIINNIIKNFPFIDPNCIAIFNLQICGMKGDFIEIILGNKKKYITHRPLDRLRAPLHRNNKIIDTFLRQLMYYKDHVETLCHDIEQMVNENDDKSALFGETLDTNTFKPPKFLDWIDDNRWSLCRRLHRMVSINVVKFAEFLIRTLIPPRFAALGCRPFTPVSDHRLFDLHPFLSCLLLDLPSSVSLLTRPPYRSMCLPTTAKPSTLLSLPVKSWKFFWQIPLSHHARTICSVDLSVDNLSLKQVILKLEFPSLSASSHSSSHFASLLIGFTLQSIWRAYWTLVFENCPFSPDTVYTTILTSIHTATQESLVAKGISHRPLPPLLLDDHV